VVGGVQTEGVVDEEDSVVDEETFAIAEERDRQLAARTAVELGAAGVGALLAGPLGATAGAILVAGIKPAVELLAVREARGVRNIQELMKAIMETTGVPLEDLATWVKSEDGRFALVTRAFQSAYDTLSDQKVRALAAVLRESLNDDAKLDIAGLIVAALSDLESPHIRVLDAMIRGPRSPGETEDQYPPGVWGLYGLRIRFRNLVSGLTSIMAVLEREAMVNGKGLAGTDPLTGQPDPVWSVTDFGRSCHRYLTQVE
jgi:hypothetical protein